MNQFHDHLSENLTWYRRWHEKPHHSVVHYALLLGVFMLLGVSFFGTAKAAGTTYYVDPSIADTNVGSATPDCTNYNPTTFACSGGTASAYKTIADINAKLFAEGDRILFKAGSTFTGTIIPTKSGTSTNRITYGSFGSGAKPIITGLSTVSGWTEVNKEGVVTPGTKIWRSNDITTLGTVNMILINGVNTAYGRTPNTGYWTAASATATSITDGTRLNASTTNWTGANVAIRTAAWHLDRTTVTSASGSTINFSQPDYKPEPQNGYFFQNHPYTLDLQNEWSSVPGSKKVMIYSASAPTNVKVPTIEYGADLNGKNYITFDGLNFQGFNSHGVYVNGSTGITVQNSDFSFIADSGVYTYTNTGDSLTVSNSTFNEINSGGVITRQSGYTTVQNSTFNKIGNLEGMAGGPSSGGDVNYTAVQVAGYSKVLYNTITNVGYVGIRFNGPGVLVQGNYVDRTTYIKDDGGGIYTFPNEGDDREPVIYTGANRRVVRDNIVLNSIGAPWGKKYLLGKSEGMCIYNDGTSSYTDYINNTMAYCRWGYFSNGGKHNTISGNTIYMVPNAIYGHATGDIYGISQKDYKGETWTTLEGNNYTNNTIVLGATNAGLSCGVANYALEVLNRGNTLPSDWTASNNIYANPLDQTNPLIYSEVGLSNGPCSTLAQWKTGTNKDTGTTGSPITVSSASSIKFEYTTSSPKTLDLSAGYVDMKGVVQACSRTIPAYSSVILLKKPNTTCTGGTADTTAPTVSIDSPINNGTVTAGINTVTATAGDTSGITRVDFYRDGTILIGQDADVPYSISWNLTGVPNGTTYDLTAKATDASANANVGTSSTVRVTVAGGDPTAPTVRLDTPVANTTVFGANVQVSATASDNVAVTKVEFILDNTTILATDTSSLYQFFWDTTTVSNGSHTITAKAYDAAGNTTSATNTITVNNNVTDITPPTFEYPFQTFTAGTQYILIGASDEAGGSGMDKVDFYLDGAFKDSDTSRNSPYGFELDSTTIANGNHTIYAIAYDIAGNFTTSTTATFTINNPDITPPATVTLTAPTAGAILVGDATLTATATDNIGIDHIDFYRGGTTLIGGVIGTAPYTWDTTNTPDGTYTLTAKAYDAAGNSKTSAGVSIEVKNTVIPLPDTTAPVVTMTTPASGTTVSGTTVTLAADATDASGINNVKFYRSGSTTALDTDLTPYPGTNNYAITWDSKTVANGTYTITAKATDGSANANVGTSAGITITVYNDITAPSVTLAAPATAGQNIAGTFVLKATATDNVSMAPPGKVEFYRGGTTLIGSTQVPGTNSNFEFSWNTTSVANGTYSITAKAYDAAGNVKTSTSRNVVVDNTAPTISNTTTGGYYKAGTRLTLKATATDSNMAKVEFYVDGVLKCTDTVAAYTCTWVMPSTKNSSFTVTAKAYDKAGNSRTSAGVKVKNYTGTEVTGLNLFTFDPFVINQNSGGIFRPQIAITATNPPITRVDFYLGSTPIGFDTSTQSPFDINGGTGYNSTQIANGTYTLTATATDSLGNTGSSQMSVTIAN